MPQLDDFVRLTIVKHGEIAVWLERARYEEAKTAGDLVYVLDPWASDIDSHLELIDENGKRWRWRELGRMGGAEV